MLTVRKRYMCMLIRAKKEAKLGLMVILVILFNFIQFFSDQQLGYKISSYTDETVILHLKQRVKEV